MGEHVAAVRWQRDGAAFVDNKYSRVHEWSFDGGLVVAASSSPAVVPIPFSDPAAIDPEEAFIASISSCHMLWFLSIAAGRGFIVDHYEDEATGVMAKNADQTLWISRVTLNPAVAFGGDKQPSAAEEEALHHEAHAKCFIANSLKTEVVVRLRRGGG